jgi:adenine-specific DNA-methyltransferase
MSGESQTLSDSVFGSRYGIENRRYIGSKVRLLQNIFSVIPDELKNGHFLDIFGGTGVVSAQALRSFNKVTINDHLYSNEIIYKAFFGKGRFAENTLSNFVQEINSLHSLESHYFAREFGNRYFSSHDAGMIGEIRDLLELQRSKLTEREYCILLASLIYSADRSARTVGHYEAFLRNAPIRNSFKFRLVQPIGGRHATIYRQDANALAKKISSDVTYIDPPYNSRQYSRFYHVLETLAKWTKPKLSGVARKPPTENSSDYCKRAAPIAFADLVSSLDTRLILVSYNNTYDSKSSSSQNKISLEFIQDTLKSRGRVKVKTIEIGHFNAGKSSLTDHREYIFTCKA